VDQLEALTPEVPSLFHCKSLTVKGPVKFEGGVAVRGAVTVTNGVCVGGGGGRGSRTCGRCLTAVWAAQQRRCV
jgi:hypothetical protein